MHAMILNFITEIFLDLDQFYNIISKDIRSAGLLVATEAMRSDILLRNKKTTHKIFLLYGMSMFS